MSTNLAKRIDNLTYKELKSVVTEINNAELKGIDRLRVVAIAKKKLVENFTLTVEIIAEKHGEDNIPEVALLLFNDLYSEDDSRLDKVVSADDEPKTTAKAKAKRGRKPKQSKKNDAKSVKSTTKKEPDKESDEKALKDNENPTSEKDSKLTMDVKAEPKKENDKKKKKIYPIYEIDKYGTRPNTLARAFVESLKEEPKTMKQIQQELWNPRGYVFPDTLSRLKRQGLAEVNDGIISIIG